MHINYGEDQAGAPLAKWQRSTVARALQGNQHHLSSPLPPMHVAHDFLNGSSFRAAQMGSMPVFLDPNIGPRPHDFTTRPAWLTNQLVFVDVATACTIDPRVKHAGNLDAVSPQRFMRSPVRVFRNFRFANQIKVEYLAVEL